MIAPACPCCGIEKPPDSRSAWCGYCGYKPPPPPPPPPPQPARAWLPAAKLELGRVAIETEKRTMRLTPPLRLKLGKVKLEEPPKPKAKPVPIEEFFLRSARAISTLNLSTESRFIDQRNGAAHCRFLRLVERVAPDRSEWRDSFLVW